MGGGGVTTKAGHSHSDILVAVQCLLGHHLRELGVVPGNVTRDVQIHGRRFEEFDGHLGVWLLGVLAGLLHWIPGEHLQSQTNLRLPTVMPRRAALTPREIARSSHRENNLVYAPSRL